MADRYWVGGTGTWNTTSTTNWSATSGGAGGASVPSTVDNVFFDQAGTYTVTMTGALAAADFTVSAGTVTFAGGTSPTIQVKGSMSLIAGTLWTSSGTITFNSTSPGRTITTNGVALRSVVFNGSGGEWTLGSALTVGTAGGTPGTQTLTISQGTFNTNNYSVTCWAFRSPGSSTRVLNLGSSTITAGGTAFGGFIVVEMTSTGITLNPGTSTFIPVGPNTFQGAGLTYANIQFPSSATIYTITGANTFNNFEVQAPASAGVASVNFSQTQTVNGTLSTSGTAGNRRVWIRSSTYGISVDLVVNSAPSLTDADFRGIYVRGTAAPISGTRIGNRGECRNITFDAPKTVYWNLAGAQNWSANGWATTSTGAPSTNNFPLPQDTATFTNAGSVTGTITLDTAIGYVPTVDMSGRTTAMTLGTSNATVVHGNWTNGSGTAFTGTGTLTFSGGGTQTITSAGKTFTCPITIDTLGGTVQLGSALNIGTQILTVTNGTFSTQNYSVTGLQLNSSNTNIRTINLGSSTLSLASASFSTSTNLTLNAGTSTFSFGYASGSAINSGSGLTFYNVNFNSPTSGASYNIDGTGTFNNLSIGAPSANGIITATFSADQVINGTLTCSGASPTQRVFLRSTISAFVMGARRTLTVGTLSATDCDFRSIAIAGAASGTSPTRAGNCGDNSGISFPTPKTVYWNLAGSQNWTANGWTTTSGGTPSVNDFPLAQDTIALDDTTPGCSLSISISYPIGNFLATRSTLGSGFVGVDHSVELTFYGNLTDSFYSRIGGVGSSGNWIFSGESTQTISSSSSRTLYNQIYISKYSFDGVVQLGANLTAQSNAYGITLVKGTFKTVTYNLTTARFANSSSSNFLDMGSGTWTLNGVSTVWDCSFSLPYITAGTATIVLSNSVSNRLFAGGGGYYNKLVVGGTTSGTTLTISGANTFGELASTITVAHSILFPSSNTTTIGKWSITGTVGNVVTIGPSTALTAYTLSITGPANSGIDYLSISYCTVATDSPGEFYAGANSTNTAGNTRVIFTATPAARTLYWVGGTGNWSSTTKWSTSSGGASGAAIPTSLDAVVFDSASNATAYTATIDAGVTIARCASFTMNGPAAGNVTFAGTVGIAFHGNVTIAATGVTRTYTGTMQWAGNSSYTFTQNGVQFSSTINIVGIGATWSLGSALVYDVNPKQVVLRAGTFRTMGYAAGPSTIDGSASAVTRRLELSSSTITLAGIANGTLFGLSFTSGILVGGSLDAGTSSITVTAGSNQDLRCSSLTLNDFTVGAAASVNFYNNTTFNNLTFNGLTTVGISSDRFSGNITVTGALALPAGSGSAYRRFLSSSASGTQRTLTVASLSAGATDCDFRDIAITGAAAPLTGTRFGDCKGNSGITFPAAKTVYYRQTGSANWGATGTGSWSATSGGAVDATQFPLAQDTAVFPATTYPASGSTTSVNASYNIGTIDMSARTSDTMTLAISTNAPNIYGNWINGTGTTLTGTGVLTFAGRATQQITSAGKSFTQTININTLGGSVALQDAFSNTGSVSGILRVNGGTFDANNYSVTLSGASASFSGGTTTNTRTVAVGSGTWTISGTNGWDCSTSTNLTVTGTGTISLTSASGKTFAGGGIDYSNITLNQGGAGTLTLSGDNRFKDITNTYSATGATTIAFASTTQTVTTFTGTGTVGKVLTLSGTSAASPATLVITGTIGISVDYINVSNVEGYPLADSWKIGVNSTNSGSLGFLFQSSGGTTYNVTITESITALDLIASIATVLCNAAESVEASDLLEATATLDVSMTDTAQAFDQAEAQGDFVSSVDETVSGDDYIAASTSFSSSLDETSQLLDDPSATLIFEALISEDLTALDEVFAQQDLFSQVSEDAQAFMEVSAQADLISVVDEVTQALDSAQAQADFVSSVDEASQAEDLMSVQLEMFPAVDEAAQGLEEVSADAAFAANISESSAPFDESSARVDFGAFAAEDAVAQDNLSTQVDLNSGVQEDAQAVETVNASATLISDASDSAAVADQSSAAASFASDLSEDALAVEDVAAAQVFASSATESAQALDSASASQRFRSTISKTIRASDQSRVAESVFNAAAAESFSVSDQTSASASFVSDLSEAFSVLDETSSAPQFASALDESAQGAEEASSSQGFASSLSETAQGSDQMLVGPSVFGPRIIERVRPSDTVRGFAAFSCTVTDTARGSETPAAFLIFPTDVFEAVQVLEEAISGVIFRANLTEQASASETVSPQKTSNAALSDTATASDQAIVAPSTFNAALSETTQGTDQPAAQAIFQAQSAETARGSESTAAALIFPGNVAETAQAIEAFLANQTFAANISDNSGLVDVAQAFADFRSLVSESATSADQASTVVVFVGSIAEQATVEDLAVVSASIFNAALQDQMRAQETVDAPGSIYNPTFAASATAQDAVSPALTIGPSVSESATVLDTVNAAFTALSLVSESATAQDFNSALLTYVALTQESATAADSTLVAPSTFNAIALAAATALDNADASGSVFNASLAESATMLDSLIGGFLWTLIDDSQTPNWQGMPAVQVAGWVQVDDTQTTNWQNVPSAQGATWTEVNTTNTPNWQQEPPP